MSLLAAPLNAGILTALSRQRNSLAELRAEVGSPAQTTLRKYLQGLIEAGVVERRRQREFPGSVEFRLTEPGRGLLDVARVVSDWLQTSPEGAMPLGSGEAKSAITALVEAWSTNMARLLAIRPLSLTGLDRAIASQSYPCLERRLAALRLVGLVEPLPLSDRGTPYAVTEWMRRAVAPLMAAARWERLAFGDEVRITDRDIEAAFLLALPLLALPTEFEGSCRLAVRLNAAPGTGLASTVISVRQGVAVSPAAGLAGSPRAWALGLTDDWLSAVIEQQPVRLEMGGDAGFAIEIVEALHGALFAVQKGRLGWTPQI